MRAQFVNEKFEEETNPIWDLGIGDKEIIRNIKTRKEIKRMGIKGKILREEITKLKSIFKKYLPFEEHKNERYIIEDMQWQWWNKIVEDGWEPKSLKKIMKICYPKLKGEKLFDKSQEELSDICDKAIELLGIPHEVVE